MGAENAVFAVELERGVFHMDVENAIGEAADELDRVDHLPNEVRRVEVEPERRMEVERFERELRGVDIERDFRRVNFKRELDASRGTAVVFCHQCLDPQADANHLVRNAADVRAVIEHSGKVRAVFTGHQHSGRIGKANGIAYYSLRATVLDSGAEENSYATVAVHPSGEVAVTGYRKAASI